MKYKIICDSISGLTNLYCKEILKDNDIGFEVLPFEYVLKNQNISEDEIKRKKLLLYLESSKISLCFPSPKKFLDACNGEVNIIITVGSCFSGCFNSAMSALNETNKEIYIIDSLGSSGKIKLIVDKAIELISLKYKTISLIEQIESFKNSIVEYCLYDSNYSTNSAYSNTFLPNKRNYFSIIRNKLGKLVPIRKSPTYEIALAFLSVELKDKKTKRIIIYYTDNILDADKLKNKLLSTNNTIDVEIIKANITTQFCTSNRCLIVAAT